MSYKVVSGDTLSSIAAHHGVSLHALEAANPQIRNPNRIYVGEAVTIPGQRDSYSPPSGGHYTVRSGDTMSGIASRHGVSLHALESANPQVRNPNMIRVGERLNLPGASRPAPSAPIHTGGLYIVHSGDTMSSIASRHGVSLHALEAANPQVRNPNVISVGQHLNLPGGSRAPTPPAPPASHSSSGGTYTVRSGDTMSSIASRHGVSLGALEAANPQVRNPNVISVGERLNLPGGSHSAPSGPSPTGGGAAGTSAAQVAHQFLGESEYQLQPSGKLDMDQWVPKTEDCANFVSGCLEKAGLISHGQRSDNVVGLANNLQAAGWHYVPNSEAKPGDVVTFDGPGGKSQHVEIFDHWQGSTPVFIGSNNVMADGTQKISYDVGGTWAYHFHVLAPPGGSHGTTPSQPSSGGGSYTVRPGDTMSGIASRVGVSLHALEAANPQVTNPNVIRVGQRLNLPGGAHAPSSPTPPPNHSGPAPKGFVPLTPAQFQAIAPHLGSKAAQYTPYLNAAMKRFGITTPQREAAFLAQITEETDGFNTLTEYASGAEYEGRADLGNTHPGDGVRYKGRGAIQLTGRANYTTYGRKLGIDLVDNPTKAADPSVAFLIAGQYWSDHGLNELADRGDFIDITRRINGGTNGESTREYYWAKAKQELGIG